MAGRPLGVPDGLKPEAEADWKNGRGADGGGEEARTLDLMSALEFTRLHQALSKKGEKAKNGKSIADERTGAAIAHALKETSAWRGDAPDEGPERALS